MTVGDLVALLRDLDSTLPVTVEYDCGCAQGWIVRVALSSDPTDGVLLIVE